MNRTMHGLLAMALLVGPVLAQAAVVTVGNREWRQLTETTGFTWNEVATVCNSATGVCNGSIGTVDFTGWTWATNTDIQGLFTALIGNHFPNSDSVYVAPNLDDSAVSTFVGGDPFFRPTFQFAPFSRGVAGWSRTPAPLRFYAYIPTVSDSLRPDSADPDTVSLAAFTVGSTPSTDRGVWLSRSAPEVPVPPAAYLLVSGLAGLLGLARKRSGKTAAV